VRQIHPHSLWIGHAGDARDLRGVLDAGIQAIVQLAAEEPPLTVTRDLVYCRFPLLDGVGNPPWLLRAAVTTVVHLLQSNVPTLLACGGGLSRSPAIAAAALAACFERSSTDCLADLGRMGVSDVSPGLWQELVHVAAG
jgi:hypothetical protein